MWLRAKKQAWLEEWLGGVNLQPHNLRNFYFPLTPLPNHLYHLYLCLYHRCGKGKFYLYKGLVKVNPISNNMKHGAMWTRIPNSGFP